MYRILSASKDTYINNKITNTNFRATDSNAGQASTLDLFKLYDESVSGSNPATEISRLLIKFDLSKARTMLSQGQIDISSADFKVFLNLKDVYGGQTTPNNFKAIVFPLSMSFDEGVGTDVVTYKDLDATNWVTASTSDSGQPTLWNTPGALASGTLGDSNIDVIVSGTLDGSTLYNLSREQYFLTGEEDLKVDVTRIISGSITNQINDHGFLIAFSGSFEKDQHTYFVKRFGSNQSLRQDLKPHLSLQYDDSILDNHENFVFDTSGSLYLNNYVRGQLTNILSGTAASQITGENCMKLRVVSSSFDKTFNVSQYTIGNENQTGVYNSTFAISSFDDNLFSYLKSTTSASFDAIWSSNDLTVAYLTSSLMVNMPKRTAFDGSQKRLLLTIKNLKDKYNKDSVVKVRVFIEDRDRPIVFKKTPFETKSQIFSSMYYRIVDAQTGEIIIPFDTNNNSTRLSSDSEGMYFKLYMDGLLVGRSYKIEFLIKDFDSDLLLNDILSNFTIHN